MGSVNLSSKLDLVNAALDKMSISGITAPPQASDYQALLQRLEGIMYELEEGRNICCRYNFTAQPDTNDPHGMSYGLFEPISSLLAFKTLQDYALPIAQPLQASVASAISSISNQTFHIRETQYPRRQARGSGNTLRYNRWQRFYRQPSRVPLDCDSFRLNTNEIDDYTENYFDYLRPGEDIASHQLAATSGLNVISNRRSTSEINYRLQGNNPEEDNGFEQVKITITTTLGRVDERIINFEVLPITNDSDRFTVDFRQWTPAFNDAGYISIPAWRPDESFVIESIIFLGSSGSNRVLFENSTGNNFFIRADSNGRLLINMNSELSSYTDAIPFNSVVNFRLEYSYDNDNYTLTINGELQGIADTSGTFPGIDTIGSRTTDRLTGNLYSLRLTDLLNSSNNRFYPLMLTNATRPAALTAVDDISQQTGTLTRFPADMEWTEVMT